MCPQMLLSDPENTLLPKIAQITITYKALPLVKTMASSKKKPTTRPLFGVKILICALPVKPFL
jgi:hypothetical protein